jgi:hypothetical protein
MLRDSIVTFLRGEYRAGFLTVDPDEFTVEFIEHLATFCAAQSGGPCPRCDAVVADYGRQIRNLERWVRWLLPRRRGGRP